MKSIQIPFGNLKALQLCLYPLEDLDHHQVVTWTLECTRWNWTTEKFYLTKLRISRSINYMIMFLSEVKLWWTELVVILPCPKKPCRFYFNSINCTTPSGPDMKYSLLFVLSKWADSQFGFWTNSDSVQFFLNFTETTDRKSVVSVK